MRPGPGTTRAALALGWLALARLAAADVAPANSLASLSVTAPAGTVLIGGSLQLSVRGRFADGSEQELASDPGTSYSVAPEGTVLVGATGLLQGLSRGQATILASHQNMIASVVLVVRVANDQDNDGIPDAYESAHGLNPLDAADAEADPDHDGLTNLQEFALGTDPQKADTDGDSIPDGLELATGTDPLDPNSPPPPPTPPKLDQDCVVSVLNRSVEVKPDGSWVLPNVPANIGRVRARATCVENGVTRSGQSDYFVVPVRGVIDVPDVVFDTVAPIPARLRLTALQTTLGQVGASTQLTTTASYPNDSTANLTAASTGTNYTSSNPRIASVDENGVATAHSSGTVLMTALNDGATGLLRLSVVLSGDTDGDGIPDDVELANGLNPNDPVDALEDIDRDGLINRDELQLGTDLRNGDSDGDTLPDGREVELGTDPLVFDTDGDGLGDGLEVATGSDPLDPNSYNLAQALQWIEASPSAVTLVFNTMMGEASRQLRVTGHLIDGRILDLTSRQRGTNYASSDLTIVSFGVVDGQIFAGRDGLATVTVSNSGFSAFVPVTVRNFAPVPLSSLSLPGFANNVEVSGDYAYVAAGPAGLHVVDVSNRRAPVLVRTLALVGNANDVRLRAPYAYVAGGSAGLHVVDVSNPLEPALVASVDTPGEAIDLAVGSDAVFVADGSSGVQVIGVADPAHPAILGSLDTNGSANGVDVAGTLLAVSNSTSPPDLVDVTNLASPQRLGGVSLGSSIRSFDVELIPPHAYFTTRSDLRVLDLTDPRAPRFLGAFGAALSMKDIEKAALDLLFTTQVRPDTPMPIFRLGNPASPQFVSSIIFSSLGPGWGDGIGLASDSRFVYMTATLNFEFGDKPGTTGQTRLYIGQYLEITDEQGVPPTVALTSPSQGSEHWEGSTVMVRAQASDDVAVSAVTFLVDGVPVSSDTAAPWGFDFSVPVNATSVTFGATAVDFGGNQAGAQEVTVSVIPDPVPTVSLTAPPQDAVLTEGTMVTLEAAASDNIAVAEVSFTVNGRLVSRVRQTPYRAVYSIAPGTGSVEITATVKDNLGQTASAGRSLPVTADAPPTVSIVAPAAGATLLEGQLLRIEAAASDNRSVAQVRFLANGEPAGIDFVAPYETSYIVPTGVMELELVAEATDDFGKASQATRRLSVRAADAVLVVEPPRLEFAVGSPTARLDGPADTRTAAASKSAAPPAAPPRAFEGVVRPAASPTAVGAPSTRTAEIRSSGFQARMPLHFEPNLGQTDPAVRFMARGQGYAVFLGTDEVVLALQRPEGTEPSSGEGPGPSREPRRPAFGTDVVRVKLEGADPAPRFAGFEELPSRSHYLHGTDPAHWQTDVPHYARVEYQDVYPGVSLSFYGNGRQLEYDFVVAPGADPSRIHLSFDGAKDVGLDQDGHLLLTTSGGSVRQLKPAVYQVVAGVRRPLDGRYVRTGERSFGFELADYDRELALVIDPVLTYSTYLGGSDEEAGRGIAVDAAGNVYVTGFTASADFPVVGAVQGAWINHADAFVAKISPDGGRLVYSTYLGGSRSDLANDVAVDALGQVYLTGYTDSPDFPTMNPLRGFAGGPAVCGYQPPGIPAVCADVFLAKLTPEGSGLVYSTYLGGTHADSGVGVAADAMGQAVVVGSTLSSAFPTTVAAIQPTFSGGMCGSWPCSDSFAFKVLADGSGLVYSTYMGITGKRDWAHDVALDSAGNAYIVGGGQPVPSALPAVGPGDAFVVKLTPTGGLGYVKGLGGSGYEEGLGVAVDGSHSAYVVGYTLSTDFPTVNPFQAAPQASGPHYFVSKLDPTGTYLVYSSYLGSGTEWNTGGKIAVDGFGNAYVAGVTHSALFPALNPLLSCTTGGAQTTLTKVDATGSALVYSTCFAGVYANPDIAVAVDGQGAAYLTGAVDGSAGFPTLHALQPGFGGYVDAFVSKISTQERYQFSATHFSAVEGAGEAELTVRRIDRGNFPTSVSYVTANGSAIAPADYVASSGTLDFAYGDTSKTIRIPIVDDGLAEADETFRVVLTGPTGEAVVGEPGTATVTIVNDDDAPPPQVLSGTLLIRDAARPAGPHWQATEDIPWLSLSAYEGDGPSMLVVTVNPAGLGFGIHTGTITVTAGAAGSPQVVAVSLRVGEIFSVEPSVLHFVHTVGQVADRATAPGGAMPARLAARREADAKSPPEPAPPPRVSAVRANPDSALSRQGADGSGRAETIRVAYQTDGTRSRARPQSSGKNLGAGLRANVRTLPLYFEPNLGQTSPGVAYVARGRGFGLLMGSREVSIALASRPPAPERGGRGAAVTMRFEGAAAVTPAGDGELPGRSHYLVGGDPTRWRRDVPHYAKVLYRDLYPGVDAVFYGRDGELEYDLIAQPGADIEAIEMSFDGVDGLRVDETGDLVLSTGGGEIHQRRPLVYQDRQGVRVPLDGGYVQKPSGRVGFQIAGFDPRWAVVIDPVLSYSSYLGGTDSDMAVAIAVDGAGDIYVGGYTPSPDFPTHAALQPAIGSADYEDAFVTKIRRDGTIAFSTYLGGGGDDGVAGLALDPQGNVYLTGWTSSNDFPTRSAFQPAKGGPFSYDAFVAKLSADGSALLYSTYLGGGGSDEARGIAVDRWGAAYVVGAMGDGAPSFPIVNPFYNVPVGSGSFAAKLNPEGSGLVYSTPLPGTQGGAIAVDRHGNAYVTGSAVPSMPAINALQPASGGSADVFVTKLNAIGFSVGFSTFLGGSGDDYGRGIAVDEFGNVYVTGQTDSYDFPLVNAFQGQRAGFGDAFLTKIHAGGSSLVYSTYLGGNGYDAAGGIALDAARQPHLTGFTESSDFPVAAALQPELNGPRDVFVTKLNATASAPIYSTYLGGSWYEWYDTAIAVDRDGAAVVAGATLSTDFPTVNPTQSGLAGEVDVFVSRITDAGIGAPVAALSQDFFVSSMTAAEGPPWQVAVDVPWLSLSESSGTGPSRVTATVNPASLAVGVYTGHITVTAEAANSPQVVTVVFALRSTIVVEPANLLLSGTTDGSGTSHLTESFVVRQSLLPTGPRWLAAKTANWLNLSASAGMGPSTVTVTADVTGLGAGDYFDAITVTDEDTGDRRNVSVTLTVADPGLAVTPEELSFSVDGPGQSAEPQALSIFEVGLATGPRNWQAEVDAPWLRLSTSSGDGPASLMVSVVTDDLDFGTYQGTITIAADAPNSPRTVLVTLSIGSFE